MRRSIRRRRYRRTNRSATVSYCCLSDSCFLHSPVSCVSNESCALIVEPLATRTHPIPSPFITISLRCLSPRSLSVAFFVVGIKQPKESITNDLSPAYRRCPIRGIEWRYFPPPSARSFASTIAPTPPPNHYRIVDHHYCYQINYVIVELLPRSTDSR